MYIIASTDIAGVMSHDLGRKLTLKVLVHTGKEIYRSC